MARPGVMFYFDIRPCIKRLTLEEKGQLFEAVLDYAECGTEPEFDGVLGIAWDFIQPKLDKDGERYETQIEQKQYAVFVREIKKQGGTPVPFAEWRALTDTERNRLLSADTGCYPTTTTTSTSTTTTAPTTEDKSRADKPPTRPRFNPPTVKEVKAYCTEKGYGVDPQRFVDYYTSNGWMVGKNHMKDWKAAVRTWHGKENTNGKTESRPTWTIGTEV